MNIKNSPYSVEVGACCLSELGGNRVEVASWREKFMEKYDAKNNGAKRKAFCVAKQKLAEIGIVEHERRWLVLVDLDKLKEFMCQ